ncbi:methyltransferase domain-containing protein [Actinomadura sp. DSM 109109]|nr:methyltransferase domain-containing protein [Actinomadura lepetitiana]
MSTTTDAETAALEESYDAIPYPSKPNPGAHPDRLATVALLCGLETAPPARCRYLELGCGDGAALVALAVALPESEFVGVDIAGQPIARGQAIIADLGLTNVRIF